MNDMNWKRRFYTIWVGQAFSQLSSSILQFAMIWYLTASTKSGIMLAMATMMAFLPQGILGLFVGVFIDRFNRKKIMIGADSFIAVVSLLLIFTAVDGVISPTVILWVLFCRAVGSSIHNPTLEAVTPQMVPRNELVRCAGYTQSLRSVSMIFSPVIAAVLFANWHMSWIVMLDVVGAAFAVITVALVKIPKHKVEHEGTEIHFIKEVKEGFQILGQEKGMTGIVLVTAVYSMAMMPVSSLFPLMSMKYFGGTSTSASIVETIFAVGYLVGGVVLANWGGTRNRVYTIAASYFMMAVALIGSGVLPDSAFPAFVCMAFLMGFSGPFYWGTYGPMLQTHFKEEHLGRIFSITGSMRFISGPIALTISGFIADYWGEEKWFFIGGAAVFICFLVLLCVPSIRSYDAPLAKEK